MTTNRSNAWIERAERWSCERPNTVLASIIGAFVIGNVAALAWTGVRAGGDTGLYLAAAARLLKDGFVERIQIVHTGYLIPVAIVQAFGLGLTGLVVIQIAIAALAIAAVYRLGVAVSGPVAGLVAAAMLAFDVQTARWHAYVLTDSLYLSVLAVSIWLVHRLAADPSPTWRRACVSVIAVVLVALIRPEGWLLPPLAALYCGMRARSRPVKRVAVLTVLLMCASLTLLFVPRLRAEARRIVPLESYRSGRTIWGTDRWSVPMPVAPAARVAVHVAHVRPSYSLTHNVLIVAWLVPSYVLAVRGWRAVRHDSLARWLLAVIAAHSGVVALTHADWDGRYLAHVLPLIYVYSGCGITDIVRHTE